MTYITKSNLFLVQQDVYANKKILRICMYLCMRSLMPLYLGETLFEKLWDGVEYVLVVLGPLQCVYLLNLNFKAELQIETEHVLEVWKD